jgi:DNA-binding Lrp family transcriptional regulator
MGWQTPLSPATRRRAPHEIAGFYLAPRLRPRKSAGHDRMALREIKPCQSNTILLDCSVRRRATEAAMVPFFIQIKCQLGRSYQVANALADSEIASEIYSTAGEFDLLAKFYVDTETDIGHFVNEKVQTIPGIQDTRTIITFKAFGA